MPFGNDDLVNEIKNRLDIVDIISEKVRLKKSGRSYSGLCPFHHEKTGSFHVFPDTQTYYCFGCNSGGNIFTFVMKTEGYDFKQALTVLAERAGIKMEPQNNKPASKNLYDVTRMAAEFFMNNLKSSNGAAAQAYMKRRNLSYNDIENYTLGYSLMSWDSLTNYLKSAGFSQQQIINAGLAIENKDHIYDRVRGRLIFPVKDITGRIIAFGGRLIDGEGAKYINSPECEIYSKKNNLYMLYEARNAMKKKHRSILVEGYMDALRLHKCGFTESVASLGTSLTEEQAKLLSRFSETCYICYDSDTAGQEAALRGMYILHGAGLEVRVVDIPEGKDPDEFLSANPPEKFEQALKNSTPLIIKHLDFIHDKLINPAQYNSGIKSLFDGLSKMGEHEITAFSARICGELMISPDELMKRIKAWKNNQAQDQIQVSTQNNLSNENQDPDRKNLEAGICSLLWKNAEYREKITPEEIFKHFKFQDTRDIALAILTEGSEALEKLWLEIGDNTSKNLIAMGDLYCSSFSNDDIWKIIYNDLKNDDVQTQIKQLTVKLQQGKATKEDFEKLYNLKKIQEADFSGYYK